MKALINKDLIVITATDLVVKDNEIVLSNNGTEKLNEAFKKIEKESKK